MPAERHMQSLFVSILLGLLMLDWVDDLLLDMIRRENEAQSFKMSTEK